MNDTVPIRECLNALANGLGREGLPFNAASLGSDLCDDLCLADGSYRGLCECCGLHRFSDDGTRLCVTHPADADVSAEPCDRCLELIG